MALKRDADDVPGLLDLQLLLAAALSDLREAVAADNGQLQAGGNCAESDHSNSDNDEWFGRSRVRSVVSEVSLDPSLWVS